MGLLDRIREAKKERNLIKQGAEATPEKKPAEEIPSEEKLPSEESEINPQASIPSDFQLKNTWKLFRKTESRSFDLKEGTAKQTSIRYDQNEIVRILDSIEDIPTLPVIATRTIEMINAPLSDAKGIAAFLKNDQALAAKVLKVANSAFYAGYQPVTSIQHAIARLGIHVLKRMITSVSVFESFKDFENTGFNLREFWKHALAVATCSRLFASLHGAGSEEELFTAGLLHDIGKLIMARYIPEMLREILKKRELEPDMTFFETETSLFHITHADIGSWLAIKWNLARPVQNVIFAHHTPPVQDRSFNPELVRQAAIVNVADNLVKLNRIGFSGDSTGKIEPDLLAVAAGGTARIDRVVEELLKEVPSIEAYLGTI